MEEAVAHERRLAAGLVLSGTAGAAVALSLDGISMLDEEAGAVVRSIALYAKEGLPDPTADAIRQRVGLDPARFQSLVSEGYGASLRQINFDAMRVREASEARRAQALMERTSLSLRGRGIAEQREIVSRAANDLLRVLSKATGGTKGLYEEAGELIASLDEVKRRSYTRTGLFCLDSTTGGLPNGRVTVFAARPGQGKTALACEIALYVARNYGGRVVYFSAEVPAKYITIRALARLSGVDSRAIDREKPDGSSAMTAEERVLVTKAFADMRGLDIVIDENPSPTADYMRGRLLSESHGSGISLVIFDYLEFSGEASRGDFRHALRAHLQACHEMAKEHQAPFIVLSQLNREADHADHPSLRNLAESSFLEKVAALVGILRHEHGHWLTTGRSGAAPDKSHLTLYVDKNTRGDKGAFPLRWDQKTGYIYDPNAPDNIWRQ